MCILFYIDIMFYSYVSLIDIIACNYYIRSVCVHFLFSCFPPLLYHPRLHFHLHLHLLIRILCREFGAASSHHVEVAKVDLLRFDGLYWCTAQLCGWKFASTFQCRQLQHGNVDQLVTFLLNMYLCFYILSGKCTKCVCACVWV